MSYSKDLREKALKAVRNGHTKAEISRMFKLGENTLRDWEILEAETGSLENRPLIRTAYKIGREKLLEWYRNNPYSTNAETAAAFNCSISGIRSAKKVLGITRKKTQFNTPSETNKSGKRL
jgi:transposase